MNIIANVFSMVIFLMKWVFGWLKSKCFSQEKSKNLSLFSG